MPAEDEKAAPKRTLVRRVKEEPKTPSVKHEPGTTPASAKPQAPAAPIVLDLTGDDDDDAHPPAKREKTDFL